LWREANAIAEHMYDKISAFPEEEKWYSAVRIKTATLDMLFHTSAALGGSSSSTTGTDWSYARKGLSALRTLYPFVAKQGFLELEPEIVVRLDKMMDLVDKEVHKNYEAVEEFNEADLDHWRERYELWKKTDDK
jgi:site-specific recombinase XerD